MTDKTGGAVSRCGGCRHYKGFRQHLGMCQSPSEAVTRGADKQRGWRQTEPSVRCFNGEYSPADALSAREAGDE